MVFKNSTDLFVHLYDKMYSALRMSQNVVYEIIQDCLRQYYDDYDPVKYHRTEQLLRSAVKGDIRPSSNNKGWEAEVYFDYQSLKYMDGAQPSGEQVMHAAAYGGHGAENLLIMQGQEGYNLGYDVIQIIDQEFMRIFKDYLIAAGIPIR